MSTLSRALERGGLGRAKSGGSLTVYEEERLKKNFGTNREERRHLLWLILFVLFEKETYSSLGQFSSSLSNEFLFTHWS